MNKVQEYLIKKKAKNRAEACADVDSYVKGLIVNEARVRQAGFSYDKFAKMREMISLPSVDERPIEEVDALKALLAMGTLGSAGAVVASVIAGCDLGATTLITTAGGFAGIGLGELGIKAYKANIGNRIATTIQRNKLKREMTKAERNEKKAELYARTLEAEFDMV